MFHGFNGDFRRKPNVSIRGASKKETKQELIQRAKEERIKREAERVQKKSAIRIQSFVRQFLVSRRFTKQFRLEADEIRKKKVRSNSDVIQYMDRLNFVFKLPEDLDRLQIGCSWLIANKDDIINSLKSGQESIWKFKIARILSLCVKVFDWASKEHNITRFLRMFETFTSSKAINYNTLQYFYTYLFPRNYFHSIRHLCDTRIPPLIDETENPPIPAAQLFLEMILNPLRLFSQSISSFRALTTQSLSANFFELELSDQVRYFVLPALSGNNFPLLDWIIAIDLDKLNPTKWFLYSFLKVGKNALAGLTGVELNKFLLVAAKLTKPLVNLSVHHELNDEEEEVEEDESNNLDELGQPLANKDEIMEGIIEMLNATYFTAPIISGVEQGEDSLLFRSLSTLCHNLLLSDRQSLHKYTLLSTLAFKSNLLRRFWNIVIETRQLDSLGKSLLSLLSKGLRMSRAEQDLLVPPLAVFASIFGYLLITVHDSEFFGDGSKTSPPNNTNSSSSLFMPFNLDELIPMSLLLRDVALGLVELAYPDSRPTVRDDYVLAVKSVRNEVPEADLDTKIWSHLFKKVVELLRQFYTRDARRQYCPDDHWICKINLPIDKNNGMNLRRSRLRQYRPFQALRVFTKKLMDEEGPPLTTKEVRLATILREMPFAISFSQRVNVFLNLLSTDKTENQRDMDNFMVREQSIHVAIRRDYIYEDAFDKLSPENEPNMKLKMRVQLRNAAGLDEAGIDGGGLFREFMTQLLKTAFDPNRGYFKLTTDQQLYPNPLVRNIDPNFVKHYYFIGRMLGKILYENHMVEIPFASFFITKLFGLSSAITADIDHLSSLDPELYKNLLYLKNYTGDVKDLNVDFTIVTEEFGETAVEELKPGGSDIPVTNENKIEYIHLIADFKLNQQIRVQCNAFRQGLSDVINLDWLRMFSFRELQTLISGAENDIDLIDLKAHTKYGNGFSPNHPTIEMFWKVLSEMDDKGKRALLKFVTSCSRPPLLGFKELDPPFCIQNVGEEEDRLPTASTCMNLLKLPAFKDEITLREKLTYAIESESGFELS